MPYYTATFLLGAHRFRLLLPKRQTFSEILWTLPIDYSQDEKTILGIFAYLFIYDKSKFSFLKQWGQAVTRLFWEQAIFAQNASIAFWL